ncbi:MAG: YqiA/YcfP family alpha/beta fold hydrolase [Cyanobacteria bacterium P01_A01_bin.105]
MQYLYLHGFASGPQSTKAQALRSHFQALGLTLTLPDLNQGDFTHLTLTRQIQQVVPLVTPNTVLIGSSLGGLVASWVAQRTPVARLILLAPAFNFLNQWLPRLGPDALERWQQTGLLSMYHYAQQRPVPLHYDFLTDAQRYDEAHLSRAIPTLILHGERDDVVSLAGSEAYAAPRPWVTLKALPTDHSMTDVIDQIWAEVQLFCGLVPVS